MSYKYDYLDKSAYNSRTGNYKFKREFSFIIGNGEKKFENVLDIAGGSGRFAIPLYDHSENITVVDINEDAIRLLKERNAKIKAICGDFVKIKLEEKFSLILCMEAMGYFPDFEFLFTKIERLLTDDGFLILIYNNPDSWRFYLSEIAHWIKGPYPYQNVKLKCFKKLLRRCNLEIERMEGMNWIPLPVFSNSLFVTFFVGVEKLFQLKKWLSQSPWILMQIKKIPHKVVLK